MAGTYKEGQPEVLSGVYTLIQAAVEKVGQWERGVAAFPFTADWGPVNTIREHIMKVDFDAEYHTANTTLTASKISKHAYNGTPKKLLAYRMATPAAAKGTVVLQDAGGVAALMLETLYPSAREFVAVVRDSATAGNKIVEIVEGGAVIDSAEASTATGLAELLNLSAHVRVQTTGANLPANTAGTAFNGGNNGSAVTVTEYAAFLDALEAEEGYHAFALDGVTDEGILTTAEVWTRRVRAEGQYVTFVRGGSAAWDTDINLANTKSRLLNHRGIINVGQGAAGFTGADMAIFIAARVASIALNRTLTDEPLPKEYATVNKKLTRSQRITAKLAGTIVFVQKGDRVLIDEGVNTLTAPAEGESKGFGKIRVNNALDHIARDLEAFGEAFKRDFSNTEQARQVYAATIQQDYLQPLARSEVIQPGYFYKPDPDFHGKDPQRVPEPDEAFFYSDITPVDSPDRIYQKFTIKQTA